MLDETKLREVFEALRRDAKDAANYWRIRGWNPCNLESRCLAIDALLAEPAGEPICTCPKDQLDTHNPGCPRGEHIREHVRDWKPEPAGEPETITALQGKPMRPRTMEFCDMDERPMAERMAEPAGEPETAPHAHEPENCPVCAVYGEPSAPGPAGEPRPTECWICGGKPHHIDDCPDITLAPSAPEPAGEPEGTIMSPELERLEEDAIAEHRAGLTMPHEPTSQDPAAVKALAEGGDGAPVLFRVLTEEGVHEIDLRGLAADLIRLRAWNSSLRWVEERSRKRIEDLDAACDVVVGQLKDLEALADAAVELREYLTQVRGSEFFQPSDKGDFMLRNLDAALRASGRDPDAD